jgi:MFS family permease
MATASLPRTAGNHEVVGLVTTAHFFSHLYILALPSVFPLIQAELGLAAVHLGLAVAAANATTMLLQTPTGFLVDRWGAARLLAAGQAAFAAAILLVGLAPGLGTILGAMVLAGLGNAVYHPANYAILAARVPDGRIGRAFSLHTFGGYAGFAAAPLTLAPLAQALGWRAALVAAKPA